MSSHLKAKQSFFAALYLGFLSAFADARQLLRKTGVGLRWTWRCIAHHAIFGGEPGDVIFEHTKGGEYNRLIQRGAQLHLAVFAAGSVNGEPQSVYFVLSNRYFNDRIQPDQAETETIAKLLEQAVPGLRLARLMWNGRLYTPYEVGHISLQRYPGDVSLPAERRWIGQI